MKYLLAALVILCSFTGFAQVKVTQGGNSPQFTLPKQPKFKSFSTTDANYFVVSRTEKFVKTSTLVIADKTGNVLSSKDVTINMGVFNNSNTEVDMLVLNNNPVLFIENHNKAEGKNTLMASTVDKAGNVSSNSVTIASMPFTKMTNPGDWFVCLTPDKKHVAVISKGAYEKNTPEQFNYYILDEQLKEVSKGQFSFAGNTKQIYVSDFFASDKGDFYILAVENDKSYKFPMLYKYTAGGQPNIIPVMIANPDLRSLNYVSKINAAGDLIIAGYSQAKQSFTFGDTKANGTWVFNSLKPNEVKTYKFETPVTNLTARNLVFNGDTFYLIGEQYKAEKEASKTTGPARLYEAEVFNYTHNDIMVTAFASDGSKKFEMPLSRQFTGRDYDSEFMVASGIINNKLCLVYNDAYGKYIDERYYRNYKLPVAVLINNDGLMENPVPFAKDLDVKVSTYALQPQFYSNDGLQMVLLSTNSQSVKTVTFK